MCGRQNSIKVTFYRQIIEFIEDENRLYMLEEMY